MENQKENHEFKKPSWFPKELDHQPVQSKLWEMNLKKRMHEEDAMGEEEIVSALFFDFMFAGLPWMKSMAHHLHSLGELKPLDVYSLVHDVNINPKWRCYPHLAYLISTPQFRELREHVMTGGKSPTAEARIRASRPAKWIR